MVKRKQYFNKNVEVFELTNLTGELGELISNFLVGYKSRSLSKDIFKSKLKPDSEILLFPETLLCDFLSGNNINQGDCDVPDYSFKIDVIAKQGVSSLKLKVSRMQ